ncbi:hypothetical protein [Streptomyces sp. NPDC058295]|uniref:hypothetical protein n=1 Tax=Streptomyces sp. NPDC058295 TaxID=3346431 RepID=UPI0036EEAC33
MPAAEARLPETREESVSAYPTVPARSTTQAPTSAARPARRVLEGERPAPARYF